MCQVTDLEEYKQRKEESIIFLGNRKSDKLVRLDKAMDIIRKILEEKCILIEENKKLKSELIRRKSL